MSSLSGRSGWRAVQSSIRFALLLAAVVVLSGLLGSVVAVAEDPKPATAADLPKAEVILDKWVEASGGKEVFEKIHNRVTKATFEIMGIGVKLDLTTYQQAPNKSYVVLKGEAIGTHEEGSDGKVYWEVSTIEGPRVIEGKEKDFSKRGAVFNQELNWRKLYPKVECVGVEDIEGASCYALTMTPEKGGPEKWYINKKTHLIAKGVVTYPSKMGDLKITNLPGEYKSVDGVMIPYFTKSLLMSQTRLITVTSVEHNAEIPEDRFALPDDIKKLLEATKEE